MKNLVMMAAAVSALVTITSRAEAIEYPFCSSIAGGRTGIVERCDFSTMEQCRMAVSGLAGSCAPNWRYAFIQPAERPINRRSRERLY